MIATRQRGALAPAASALVNQAMVLIARGAIPLRPYRRVEAGFGNHESCQLCERFIEPTEARYRVRCGTGEESKPLAFHVHCYIAWETAAKHLED